MTRAYQHHTALLSARCRAHPHLSIPYDLCTGSLPLASSGQLDDPTLLHYPRVVMLGIFLLIQTAFATPADLPPMASITLQEDYGCGISKEGDVLCWGSNAAGQRGVDPEISLEPVNVIAGLKGVQELYLGARHACAMLSTRQLQCWGSNDVGQLGLGDLSDFSPPSSPRALPPVMAAAVGENHTCAVSVTGELSCWGGNLSGQVGASAARQVVLPQAVPNVGQVFGVAAGRFHTCVAGGQGAVSCFGDNRFGQLARPISEEVGAPAPITHEIPPVREIASIGNWTCASHENGASCWGEVPKKEASDLPTLSLKASYPTDIAMTEDHACALEPSGIVSCWGEPLAGQLGSRRPLPVVRGSFGLPEATSVGVRSKESCATRPGGRVVCWGRYTNEELDIAEAEVQTFSLPKKKKFRPALSAYTRLLLSMDEMLAPGGARPRVLISTVENHPCANTKLAYELEETKRSLIVRLGDPIIEDRSCIPTPSPAVAAVELPTDQKGRRDLVVRMDKKEDFYQVYLTDNKMEVIPLQDTFTLWDPDRSLWRIPPGALAISCSDFRDSPVCLRRLDEGLPRCSTLFGNELITSAPPMKSREYTNGWFSEVPGSLMIAPDGPLTSYRRLIEESLRDGSGCLDIQVRTYEGEIWSNAVR